MGQIHTDKRRTANFKEDSRVISILIGRRGDNNRSQVTLSQCC